MKKMGMFLLGAVSGGILAASLVLLLTPESGEDVMNKFTDYSNSMRDDIRQAAQTRRQELEQELARLRQRVNS